MAEGILNDPEISRGRFNAYSAGSFPKGRVNPLALATLAANGLSVEGYHSKSWNDFAGPDAPSIDFVFTVCDQAASEPCPLWPGRPATAHWSIPDPAAVEGSDEARRQAFQDAFADLRHRIVAFVDSAIG
jgi:protein-tyrosine-phosphatase